MHVADHWRQIFDNWPRQLPRKGMAITTFNETIPFRDFIYSEGVILLDRDGPDSLGARKIMLPFAHISNIKFTDVIEFAQFEPMGFHVPM